MSEIFSALFWKLVILLDSKTRCSICSNFEQIKQRCLKHPENSEEMMNLIDFVKDARTMGE